MEMGRPGRAEVVVGERWKSISQTSPLGWQIEIFAAVANLFVAMEGADCGGIHWHVCGVGCEVRGKEEKFPRCIIPMAAGCHRSFHQWPGEISLFVPVGMKKDDCNGSLFSNQLCDFWEERDCWSGISIKKRKRIKPGFPLIGCKLYSYIMEEWYSPTWICWLLRTFLSNIWKYKEKENYWLNIIEKIILRNSNFDFYQAMM